MARTNQPQPDGRGINPHDRVPEVLPDSALRLLFEQSPDAILLIDGEVFVDCNQAAVEMLHYASKDELLSTPRSEFSPLVQPDGRSSFEKANEMISMATDRGSHRFEWVCKRADGTLLPVEVLLTAISLEGRQILYSVWRDVSRRKAAELERSQAEAALLNQTEILSSILNNMGDAVIVADSDHRFLIFNPAAERMFGSNATEMSVKEWSGIYGLYLADEVTPFPFDQLPLVRAIRGEEVRDVGMVLRHERAPDGLWTKVNGRPLRDAKGELVGGVIVCRDVTERKKEEAFRAGQSRILEMIATGKPLGEVLASLVLLIEAQSDGMLCSILMLNEDGKHVRHGAAPSLPETYVRAVDGAPIGPKNGSCGTAMFRGKQVIVTDILEDPLWEDYRDLATLSGLRACWSTPILSGMGKVLGSFAMYYRQPQTPTGSEARLTEVATHIAGMAIEHQLAEEALRHTQAELAHVARVTTMGELTASIAHEVNQPLGAIVGNADICLHWLEESQPDLLQLREAITDISNDGRRASEVIARVRSLAKKSVPEKKPLNLSEVAGEVLEIVGHEAQRKQVALKSNLATGLPTVDGDRVQLQQVLLNLVMNGMEAMNGLQGRKQELTVNTCWSEAGVLVAVCDCGIGIESENAEQLFKAFHTTKSAGMGMGLAISRSIIEAHGGRLWAEANQETGATFKFTLPACGKGAP